MMNRRLLLLIVPLLLWLMTLAAINGISYVTQYRINAAVDDWHKQGTQTPSIESWTQLETSALSALTWDDNPDLLNACGRLYQFHAIRLSTTLNQKQKMLQQSVVYYRQVIKLRPAWPYGYMNLVMAKASAGAIDQEYISSLLQLTRLGPWEDKTLSVAIQQSAFAWPFITEHVRSQLKPYLSEAARQRPRDVRAALKGSRGLTYFCTNMVQDEPLKLCGKMEP